MLCETLGGGQNVGIGSQTLCESTGSHNTVVGAYSMQSLTTGIGNVGLGYHVGHLNQTGNCNVFLGICAGYNETGSNKLYIATNTGCTLIYGEFDNKIVCIDNKLITTNFQMTSGATAGNVLTSDASGNASWETGSTGGVTPTDNILEWDAANSWYAPYTTNSDGKLSSSSTRPTIGSGYLTFSGTLNSRNFGVGTTDSYVSFSNDATLNAKYDLVTRYNFVPSVTDGATAVAYFFDTHNNLSTTGAKLLSLRNQGTEQFYVGRTGIVNTNVGFGAYQDITSTDNHASYVYNRIQTYVSGVQRMDLDPSASDSASTEVYKLDTSVNLTTAGAKLLTVRNLGTEKFFVDKDGNVNIGGELETDTIKITTGAATGCVLTSDASGNGTWSTPSSGGGIVMNGNTVGGLTTYVNATTVCAESGIVFTGGSLGIGISSPNVRLHVVANTGEPALQLTRASGQPSIKSTSSYLFMDSNAGYASINHYVGDDVALAYGGGNVGIGDATPSFKLDVAGTFRATGASYHNAASYWGGNTHQNDDVISYFGTSDDGGIWHNGINLYIRNQRHSGWLALEGENSSGTVVSLISGDPDGASSLAWAGTTHISTTSAGATITGDLGVGFASPSYKLDVDGTTRIGESLRIGGTTLTSGYNLELSGAANKGRAADWTATSDIRLKTNVDHYSGVLDGLVRLSKSKHGISLYNRWVIGEGNKPTDEINPEREVGHIAQEMLEVFPEIVSGSEKEFYDISYMRLASIAVQGVAELKSEKDVEIEELQRRVTKLESEINNFKN